MDPQRKIADAPRTRSGVFQVRPRDVLGVDGLLIVDVRPARDLQDQFGHIYGVLHRPEDEVITRGLDGVDLLTPVVVVCNNGRDSRKCAEALCREHGFVEVYHLVGGMVRWTAEECPVSYDLRFVRTL